MTVPPLQSGPPRETDTAQRPLPTEPHVRVIPGRWALQLISVSLCVLFFQGCQNSQIQLTTGPLTPFAEIDYDDSAPLDSRLTCFSALRLLINLIGLAVLLLVLPCYSIWARKTVMSTEVQLALILVAVLFNSILFFGWLWTNAVFWPTNYLIELLQELVGEPRSSTAEQTLVAVAARLHFLICWTVTSTLLLLGKWVARRYVFIEPDRWWQFNLRTLLLATFIVGTGLGMLLRLWR